MKTSVVAILPLALLLAGAQPAFAATDPQRVKIGVVSLRVTVQEFDESQPWNKRPERVTAGSALVLREKLLLTTADMVRNATLIEVRKRGRYPNYQAEAVVVNYEVDLALLKVDAPGFWRDLTPLPISGMPARSGRFEINRWRNGGRFEQGTGEVVEFRVATSRFGTLELPMLRGSTGMTGLGWAEVLTLNGEVIGIMTGHGDQGLRAVPGPVLRRFIAGLKQDGSIGFAHRGFTWQRLNQTAMRRSFGLSENSAGVLVRRVYGGGTGTEMLKEGDILIRIGENTIDPEGQIDHRLYGQILFTIALNDTLEKTIPATVIRNGKTMEIRLRRAQFGAEDYRIHPYEFDRPADFEVFGGLVVQELSLDYLRQWGADWQQKAPARLVIEYALNALRGKGEKSEKVLIVTKVLSDPVNLGYEEVTNAILVRVNGNTPASLDDFRSALRLPSNGFHTIEIKPGQGRGTLVFAAEEIEEANRRIHRIYGVSPSVRRVTGR